MKKRLTLSQLAKRWHCSPRNAQRHIKAFALVPVDYIGISPVFELGAVMRMERRRLEHKHATHGYAERRAA
jgi:hypothetical protein